MCREKKERGQGQYHVGRRNDVFILQKVPQKDELMTSSFYEKMTHTESVDVTPTTQSRETRWANCYESIRVFRGKIK